MRGLLRVVPAILLLLVCLQAASAQKFLPKSIQFKGDPEYSNKELLDAAGLKKGAVLDYAAMSGYSKRLADSGMFETVGFKFDGQDLIFSIAPATELYPIRLQNLPLTPGEELDGKLHDRVPLYHGKVPAADGLMEDVRFALEELLAADGLKAAVTATPAADPHTHRINAVSYSISAPPVHLEVAQIGGVTAEFQGRLQGIVTAAAKEPFDTAGSADSLKHDVEQFYQDHGFAAAKVSIERLGSPVAQEDAITVPFALAVDEGRAYKIEGVHLAPDTPVTQAEVDKVLAFHEGAGFEGEKLRLIWRLIETRYKAKGYLDCKVTPRPAFNEADATVNYTVDVEPGPVYHLGFVKFDNVSDALRTMLIRYWQLLPGDPFDESYVGDFILKVQDQDPALKRSLAGVKTSFDAIADPNTREVNVVIHLEK